LGEEECLGFVIRRYGASRKGRCPSGRRHEQSAGDQRKANAAHLAHHRLIRSIGRPSHLATSRDTVAVLYPDL
jgi:hypothetical protein